MPLCYHFFCWCWFGLLQQERCVIEPNVRAERIAVCDVSSCPARVGSLGVELAQGILVVLLAQLKLQPIEALPV
jgi:hypothetical protein